MNHTDRLLKAVKGIKTNKQIHYSWIDEWASLDKDAIERIKQTLREIRDTNPKPIDK